MAVIDSHYTFLHSACWFYVSVCYRFDSVSTLAPRRVYLSTYAPHFGCGRMWKNKKTWRKRDKEPQREGEENKVDGGALGMYELT